MPSRLPIGAEAGQYPASVDTPLASPWIAALLLCAAVLQQSLGHLDGDVSWFLTFAEKYVDGAVPYVDVTDPNPPAAFLALAPAIRLARATHLAVEPVFAALVFAFALLCLALSAMILRYGPNRSRQDRGLLLNASIFLLFVVPEFVFAEREHLALLAAAPFLMLLAVSADRCSVPFWPRGVAGVGAGLAICFKPFFVLPLALPALVPALRERSPAALLTPETATACAIALAYGLVTAILFPAYVNNAIPVISEVYQPARLDAVMLAFLTLSPINALLLFSLFLVSRGGVTRPPSGSIFPASTPALVCGLASLGFLLTFFIQGKGWMNHAYPGVVLALFAWIFFLLDPETDARRAGAGRVFKFVFLPIFLAAPMLFGANKLLADEEEQPGLRAEIARVAPPHPRLVALAPDLSYGHPVTRHLAGTWVGRPNALWVSTFANHLLEKEQDPARRARLEEYRRIDLDGFAQDVRAGRPDAIIVSDPKSRDFGLNHPAVADVLGDYEKTGQAGEVEVWTRKPR